MLYAPAVCERCGAVFPSGEVIAESPGEPSSYRRSAGPCPRCGGRGNIPDWVFRFHAIAAAAREQATPEQIASFTAALRLQLSRSGVTGVEQDQLTAELDGPWHAVALELRRRTPSRRTPSRRTPSQRTARLTLLLWMFDAGPATYDADR